MIPPPLLSFDPARSRRFGDTRAPRRPVAVKRSEFTEAQIAFAPNLAERNCAG